MSGILDASETHSLDNSRKGSMYLGVDCGGTSLRIAAADMSGVIHMEHVVSTGLAQKRQNGLGEAIVSLVSDLLPAMAKGGESVGGIGIGLPFVCWDGKVHLNRNVSALEPVWLEDRLKSLCGSTVAITNDVKCAALGESWLGAAAGADPFVYLNIGTGLSAALFIDGKVYQGAHNAAGEIAYWRIEPGEPQGLDQGIGPLEEAMSGVGLSGAYCAATSVTEPVATQEIFHKAGLGDVIAQRVIEKAIDYLLPAIANILTLIDPELLVIGGGVAGGLKHYSSQIEMYVRKATPFPPRIVWSSLGGRAGLIGAIRLAMLTGR